MKIHIIASEDTIKEPEFLKMTEDIIGFGHEFVSEPLKAEFILVVEHSLAKRTIPRVATIGPFSSENYSNIKNFMWRNFYF